jgi:toxin ParE1/3/4
LRAVADFRLSERTERDPIEIYDYTEETFGAYQADAYHAGLDRTFDLLASFPLIGRAADEMASGFRRFRFQAHTIFYTEEAGFILIRAVLHQAREIKPDLFE